MRGARFAVALAFAALGLGGLAGCAGQAGRGSPEWADQGGHAALGAVLGRDLGRYTSAERARDALEAYVTAREALQNDEPNPYCTMAGLETPAHWREGKRRDVRWWMIGVDAGIARAQRETE